MIRMMIGRDLKSLYLPPAAPPGAGVLDIIGAQTDAYPGRAVSLSLRRGEILGLAGLMGAGRTELGRALFGIDRLVAGMLTLDRVPIDFATPRDAIKHGVFLVPEDRKRSGLLLNESICENIAYCPTFRPAPSAGWCTVARRWPVPRRRSSGWRSRHRM